MIYTRQGDRVTLEMTLVDYEQLLILLGYALGAALPRDSAMFRSFLTLVNELNATNPEYAPYAAPKEPA